MKYIYNLILILPLILMGCNGDDPSEELGDLKLLPVDTGGKHEAFPLGSTSAAYGHYLYTPGGYNENSPEYPLLIFLHGAGQRGDSETNPDDLDRVLVHGPPMLINNSQWSPTYPMIVASPQITTGNWSAQAIHDFIQYLIDNYNINVRRIYITGLSLGAFGSFDYISNYGSDSFAAAIVPIAGSGDDRTGEKFVDTPVWAFHGDKDYTVSIVGSLSMVLAINETDPETSAKLTIFPGVGHDSWTRTYDGTGMGTEISKYNTFDMSIYDWMFLYEKQ